MRYKKSIVLAIALLLVFSFTAFSKTQKLRRVGTCPLIKCKGKIADAEQLKTLIDKYSEHVKKGFENAGIGYLYPAFMKQVHSVTIEDKIVPLGQKFQWMLFCKGKAVKDLEWAGKKPLEVFGLTIQHDCKDYDFVIPRKCGNVSLIATRYSQPACDMKVSPQKANIGDTISIDLSGSKCATKYVVSIYHPKGTLLEKKELTAGNTKLQTNFKKPGDYFIEAEAFNPDGVASANACKAKVYINYPPVCDLKVSPVDGYTGQPFKLDASGSSDKDGKVVKAAFKITKDGQEVDAKELPELVWEKTFKKSGIYKVSLKVTDDFNATSNNDCEAELKVQKRFYGMIEGGPMLAKGTYSGYVFARVGFFYWLSPESFSLTLAAGPAINITGDPFKTHLMANLVLNAHMKSFFMGAGLGFSTRVKEKIADDNDWKAGLDIIGNIGIDVYKGFNKRASIFGEIRVPVRENLSFKKGHAFLLGFRYCF